MRKGFTLIEILAVVTIIGLIFILVIPKITTSLKNKKGDVDKTTENLVLSATKLYVSDHSSKFEKTDGNISCMPLHQLVKKGYLDGPVKNVTDDKDITNGKSVRITYDKGFKYELVDSSECKVSYCKSDYCDKDGNGYTEVEYLESTGTQYIITNIIATSGTWNISAKFKATSQYNKGSLFGSTNGFNITIDTDKVYRATAQVITSIKPSTEEFDNLNLSTNTFDNKIQLSINNNIFSGTYSNWIYNNNIGICAWGNAQNMQSGMYKEIVFVHNNVTVGYFIPVIDSSSRPCFFDKVSMKCYYNQGTGEFLWG